MGHNGMEPWHTVGTKAKNDLDVSTQMYLHSLIIQFVTIYR